MAIYTGNVNRVTGLSGIDTESMIDKMMKAESIKYEKLQKDEIKVGWKQEAYREVITALQDFQNKWFNSTNASNHIGFQSAWNNFTTTIKGEDGKESNAITIKSGVQAGKLDINITQVATAESLKAKYTFAKEKITTDSKVEDILKNFENVDEGKINLKFTLDGKAREITITKEDIEDISKFQEKLNKEFNGGIKVELDGGKLSFSNDKNMPLTISGEGIEKLGFNSKEATNYATENTKLADVLGDKFTDLFGDKDELKLTIAGEEITLRKNDTIKTLCKKIESSGAPVKLSFNQVTGKFKLEATETGANGALGELIDDPPESGEFLEMLGFANPYKDADGNSIEPPRDPDGKPIDNTGLHSNGTNAKFEIDGEKIERSSNDIDMNGLKFEINGTGNITIESKVDTDATFNKLKEFVEDYNKLIESIESKVNQRREKSGEYGYYEPLLPEEKEALSDDEIKKWEEKAKTGLLYGDDLLKGILSQLRNIPYQKVNIGGVEISLAEIGISHGSNYNSGKLEINEDKLKKAIQERGEDIAAMFTQAKTGIADQIKTVIDNAIGTKGSLREKAGIKDTASVTNNALSKELQDIAKRLAAEKERLYNKEMHYFNLFAQMETAMNQQNSQMNMLMSLLGQ